MGKFLEYVNKSSKKEDEEKKSSSKTSQIGNFGKYAIGKTLGLDTLESDLSSMGKTIEGIYNGWQTRETMDNTRISVQNMYDRLGQYQEYQKKYGGNDLTELQNSYKSILDGWDDLSKHYGQYKSADAYKNALKVSEEQAKEYEGMKTANLGTVKTEVADLEKIFGIAKVYDDKAIDFSKKSMNIKNPSAVDGFSKSLKKLTDERDAYLKSVGYESMDALEKALGEKKVYLKNATRIQDGVKLGSVGDANSEYYDSEYDKYVTKGKSIPYTEVGEETKKTTRGAGKARPTVRTIKSDTRMAAEALDAFIKNGKTVDSEGFDYSSLYDESAIFSLMTEKELKDLAYYIGKDKEDGGDRTSQYVESIKETLNYRRGNQISKGLEGKTFQQYLFGVEAGLDQFTSGMESLVSDKDYIPVSPIQYASGEVREDINYKHGTLGQGAYDLINTASNMAPSILASAVVSAATTPIGGAVVGNTLMGASAAGNARQEMLNLGYDKKQANIYAALVGTSEAVLQYALGGIGKLGGKVTGKTLKALDSIDNAFFKFATKYEVSKLGEGFEEGLQSFLEPMFMNIAAGYDTGVEVDWGEVAYSGLLGYAMGGLFEGPGLAVNTYKEASFNKNMGQTIKANERVGEVFDIASNPEVASAYDTYTRYANKGINADNIKDAQLGRLYSSAKTDAVDTLKSKKTSEEQKQSALKTLAKLSTVETENTIKKAAKEFNVGEETKITDSGDAVDIKDLRVKGDTVTVVTEKGEISVNDITLTQNDAEIVAFAKEISKTDGEDVANLFLNQYDGKTEVEEYANSFNLISTLSKYESFSVDDIMDKKGVLSTEQVIEINKNVIIAQRKANIDAQNKAFAKMRENMHLEGYVDDSIIDYENTSAEGKVNWNSLRERQRAAVTFTKGLFTALGNKVIFVAKNKKFNGMYHVDGDTIFIDVYAGMDVVSAMGSDSILPTTAHELTHQMEVYSPEIFAEVKEIVLDTLEKSYRATSKDITRGDIIASEIDRLNKLHPEKEYTEKEAIGELVAKACEDMLSVSEEGKKLFNSLSKKEQRTLTEKIKDIIKKVSDWITNLLKSYSSNSEEAKALRSMKDAFDEVSKKWDMMLSDIAKQKKSVEANQSLEKSGAFGNETSTKGEVKYEMRKTSDGIQYVVLEKNIFLDKSGKELSPRQAYNALVGQKIMLEDGDIITFVKRLPGKKDMYNELFKRYPAFKDEINIKAVNETINKNIVEIVETSKITKRNESQRYNHLGVVDFDKREVYVTDENVVYSLTLAIANLIDGNKVAYAKSFIENAPEDIVEKIKKAETVRKSRLNQLEMVEQSATSDTSTTKNIILNPDGNVKGKFSDEEKSNLADVGIQFDLESNSVAPTELFSERTWTESEYVQDRETAINAIVKALDVSKKDAERYVDNINSIARMIADDRTRLDYEQNIDETASALKTNKEYKWTVDMSTLCAKRLLFTGTFDAIQKKLPNTIFNSEDIVALRSMMMDRGYEVACGICYVESTRRELGPITADFIERYKLAQKNGTPISKINSSGNEVVLTETGTGRNFYAEDGYVPTLAELNTTDIDIVKRDHPEVYGAYLSFMKSRGQAIPKLLETRTEYKGEILKHFKAKSAVKSRNDAGGLRVQSFSDFEVAHLIDMMQIVLDMSRVGLMSQAYTKVPAFADVFGNTGMKINLSLIAKGSGLDENGNLIFDDVEGMPHREAFRLRNKYSKNVGTILVGKNDAHIRAALADPRIDFVIPFHKSFWKESLYDALGLTGYDDYTDTQNEKPFDKERKIKNFQPSEYWDYSKSGEENAQTYLKMCAEDGRIPKFPQFQNCEGYWKLLIDFKMYGNDGVGSPQMPVQPDFSMDEANDIMNSYEGGHRSFPVAQDVVDDFTKQYEGRNDIMYADRVTEITEDEYTNMKNHFGVTGNFEVAGYMLKDGKMLDFSGKHWGDTTSTFRQVDHRDIQEAIPSEDNGRDSMVNMISNGNIRLMPEVGGINLSVAPTKNQRVVLRRYIEFMSPKEGIIVDIDMVGGDTIKSFTYDVGVSADKVMRDIDNHFRGGTQSELMRFHTAEGDGVLYSDRDSEGNTLTESQQEYFKDSKVRDENGNLLVMYQGSANDFTVFDRKKSSYANLYGRGFYFTKSESHASRYGKTRAYYLNIKHPVSTTETTITKSQLRKFLQAVNENEDYSFENYGYGATVDSVLQSTYGKSDFLMLNDVSQTAIGDLVETVELFNEVNGTEYDGIMLDTETVTFNSEQAKLTSNTNPSSDPDVRYSDREDVSVYDLMGEKERLLKENEKFKAEVERLNERLKIERKVTNGNFFNENQLGAAAGHLRNISKSLIAKDKLVEQLKGVYSFIAHSPELTWEEVFERCYNIADAMLEEAKPEIVVDDYSKRILKEIRETRISLDETQKKEASYIFGKNWNRYFFGKVILSDDGISIDSKWQEWASMYPDIFEESISDGDMIGELYDIINSLRDASETVAEYDAEEQKRWLAREIYNQYWNVSPIRTTADKYDKQIRLLNFEHRRIMTEFREEYNSRLKDKLKAEKDSMKEKHKKLVAKIRERKEKEIAAAKEYGKERLSKYKENAERKTRIQSITSNALSLNELLMKNSKDKHVPEVLREPVANLLQAIDFSSKRLLDKGVPTQKDISLSKTLGKVKDMMVKASNAHNELVELYGHGLDDEIESMIDSVDDIMRNVGDNEFILNKMSITDLQTLDKMVKTIRHAVNKMNKFHTVNHAKGIANLSQESVLYLDSLGKGKVYDGLRGKTKKLLDWNNALPYYVFKRYGNGGMKVYEALQSGWDKFAFNIKKVIDYANDTYTSKEVKEWAEEVKTFDIVIPANEIELENKDYKPQYQKVQLTVPQIMSMYCLNKREQARGHLFRGGIRVADFKNSKGEIVSQADGIIFTEKDISIILNSLTKRQKEVADKLQEFMNTVCPDWGNEVSMARFGYKAFGEKNYFPIQSDANNLAVNDETEQPNSLFKLLNMSFTKSTIENADNRIVISDIFDVFAQHTSDMAKYNSLALPVLDSFKWYNYKERQDIADGTFKTSGVKQSIERAFGKDGQSYFTTFLKDINGQQEVSRDTFGKGFFSNAKIAAVGANLRVIFLQPTSYARASAVIDNKYLAKALIHKPKIKRAEMHCGIALWKSMGYYDTNIQRGVEAQIKHNDTFKDKAVDKAMKGAELADKLTWGYLWNACELEVRDKRKDLKVGSEEFYTEIGKRLREIIYATQVVDSTMTRSQMMRSGDGRDKMLTAFASEPTLAYNMLQDACMQLSLDSRSMGKKEAWKKNGKRVARILTAYTITNALAALVESGFDAFRDDDDEEMDMVTFMKLYLTNFLSDMSISGKIPYIKEAHSIIKGFGSSRSDTQWMEEMTKAITTWYKIFIGKGNASTAIKYSIKAVSDLSGLPFYSIYRDTMATLNKLDLFTAEDLNEMFEDFFN